LADLSKSLHKIRHFPFDTQCCEVNFYSWAHTISQMEIMQFKNKNTANLTHLQPNEEWTIVKTCAINKTITKRNTWWMTSYVYHMKRSSGFYVYTIFMPCFGKFTNLNQINIISFIKRLHF
jgi:nicotinic acetylcholine receptor